MIAKTTRESPLASGAQGVMRPNWIRIQWQSSNSISAPGFSAEFSTKPRRLSLGDMSARFDGASYPARLCGVFCGARVDPSVVQTRQRSLRCRS